MLNEINGYKSLTDSSLHMTPFLLPSDYKRIKRVNSFEELVTTRFENGVNALCWQRSLPGDFGEIVEKLGPGEGIVTLQDASLHSLPLSAAGKIAIQVLLEDQQRLRDRDLDPVLNCIYAYPRDEDPSGISTDVCSFHVDSATVETDTWLCTYYGAPSEGISNEEARRRVDIPETRAELLKRFGGEDNDEFLNFLNENCYDLHYAPLPQARPFSFGIGNLWRIAVEYPGSPVPPCIHRAPDSGIRQPPRLLLIS